MGGIAADIPETGKCRKYGQKRGWDAAEEQRIDEMERREMHPVGYCKGKDEN